LSLVTGDWIWLTSSAKLGLAVLILLGLAYSLIVVLRLLTDISELRDGEAPSSEEALGSF
jgi:hypothetical protein